MKYIFEDIVEIVKNSETKDIIQLSREINPQLESVFKTEADHLWNLINLCSYLYVDKEGCYLLAKEDFAETDLNVDEIIELLHTTGLFEVLNNLYWVDNNM